MMIMATMHRLSAWLVGLYLVTQLCAVIPLIACQSLHAATESFALSASHEEADTDTLGHHHHGKADDAAHQQALQDLNGVLAWMPERTEHALTVIAFTPPAMDALVEADKVRLERPPKHLLSI
jgi:hypothetical protein